MQAEGKEELQTRMAGTIRIVLGVLLILIGIFGLLFFFLGIIAIVLGAVLIWSGRDASMQATRNWQLQQQQQQQQAQIAYLQGLQAGQRPPTPAAAPSVAGERYCPACGAGNSRASSFCVRCGGPLPPAQ